ncbi:uncharacterized protein LOC117555910 [Gymnodraco acuticeps]|uniref:Uncharacterized protein LOC117555910 n=1 Tax=Gymnodraco acuticeps TaxID=8218 RepID=A0A6P8VK12_GYMAC|nr:uncharacterized protein LOC117555910 [Gymnodraco acuticeps]
MSPELRALTVPGTTADIKARVNIRSDALTCPSHRQKTWNQIEKLLEQWQTRGLIPADDQPGPTEAHRKAVVEHENAEYLQQEKAWIKAVQTPWYGPAKSAMKKAEKRKVRVTCLLIHLTSIAEDLPVNEDTAEMTKEAPLIQTPKQYPSLTEVSPPDISENNPSHQASIQAPNEKELAFEVRILSSVNQLMEELGRRMEAELGRRHEELDRRMEELDRRMDEELNRSIEAELIRGMEERRKAVEAHNDIIAERQREEDKYQLLLAERQQDDVRFQDMMADRQRREQEERRTQRKRRTNYSPDYSNGRGDEYDDSGTQSETSRHSPYHEQSQQQRSFASPPENNSSDENEQHYPGTCPKTRRTKTTKRTKTGAHTSMPLIAAGRGGFQYQSWTHRDMEALVSKLPPLTKGGQKWVTDLEKYTVQDHLCLGDMRALLGRIEGRLEARAVDSEANCTHDPDETSFNNIRSNYWAAIRHIYPTTRNLHALNSLRKEPGEEMHAFLKRCEGVWEDCTGERHDVSPAVVMLWKNAVIKALPRSVQAGLGDVVGLDAKPIEEWRLHLIHYDMKYQATKGENDEEIKTLKLRLLKIQVAEKDAEANKNKKSTNQMAILAEKAGRTPPTVQQSGGGSVCPQNQVQQTPVYLPTQVQPQAPQYLQQQTPVYLPTQVQPQAPQYLQQQTPVYLPTQVQPQAPQYIQQQIPVYLPNQVQPQAQVYTPIQHQQKGQWRGKQRSRGRRDDGCFICGDCRHLARDCPTQQYPPQGSTSQYRGEPALDFRNIEAEAYARAMTNISVGSGDWVNVKIHKMNLLQPVWSGPWEVVERTADALRIKVKKGTCWHLLTHCVAVPPPFQKRHGSWN